MCENKNKTPLEKAKEDFKQSKEKLRENVMDGDSTLCEFITHLWENRVHRTSADGIHQ